MDLKVKLGGTLDRVLTFYADEESTIPLNLSGWTYEVVLSSHSLGENPPVALTIGSGLTHPTSNTLRFTRTIDSPTFLVGLGSWHLKVVDPEGKVHFPEGGKLVVGAP